jgi:hypothetical protein
VSLDAADDMCQSWLREFRQPGELEFLLERTRPRTGEIMTRRMRGTILRWSRPSTMMSGISVAAAAAT